MYYMYYILEKHAFKIRCDLRNINSGPLHSTHNTIISTEIYIKYNYFFIVVVVFYRIQH